VHQFSRIGKLSLVGGCSKVVQDVPPFMIADGHPARVYGLNTVGLDRAGFSKEDKTALRKAYKMIFKSSVILKNAIASVETQGLLSSPSVAILIDFLKSSERGVCR
jgi:UDP-N-acetylglucosamine acyltransferase